MTYMLKLRLPPFHVNSHSVILAFRDLVFTIMNYTIFYISGHESNSTIFPIWSISSYDQIHFGKNQKSENISI